MLIGLYKRKLVLFAAIALAIVFGANISRFKTVETISADIADNVNASTTTGQYRMVMDLQSDGSILIDGKKIGEGVKALSDFDELRYIVLSQPANNYSSAEIDLNLPNKITKLAKDPEIIAVHGAESVGATLTDKQIVYRARSISSGATVTIVADFPKGYLSLSPSRVISGKINSIPGYFWLIGGIILPFIAAIIVISMLFRGGLRRGGSTNGIIDKLPDDISPSMAGLIANGRVGEREIMATLVDLAQRGFIDLYNRGTDFIIYRKNISQAKLLELRKYEIILLQKIFPPKERRATAMDVEARVTENLFSREVSMIYLLLYIEAQSMGYFSDLPARVHLRYRFFGIGSFFLGMIGYLFFAVYAPDPKFVLFFWLSLILFGVIIINLAPTLTLYTRRGKSARLQWLKLKNFLTLNETIKGHDDEFEIFLPYAIALGCEAAWAARFSESNFVKPDWYDQPGTLNGIEKFAESLLPAIDYLSKTLNTSSETLVR